MDDDYKDVDPSLNVINVEIPKELPPLDTSRLPLPFSIIPNHVQSLKECARHEIQALLNGQNDDNGIEEDIEDALDDGFVLCDLNVVRTKLTTWRRLFPRIKPFYAVKCNPDSMVTAVLAQGSAAGYDCASIPEIRMALQATTSISSLQKSQSTPAPAASIVYANPQRAEQDLETSLDCSTCNVKVLTFDGPEELYKVRKAYKKLSQQTPSLQPPRMVLRILVPDEHSAVPLGEKFGATLDQIPLLVQTALALKLPIIGVSFHCGSGNHDPTSYTQAIQEAAQALAIIDREQTKNTQPPCWLLDIGGGYPGQDGTGGDDGRFCGSSISSSNGITEEKETSTCCGKKDDAAQDETVAAIAQAVVPLLDELFPPTSTQKKMHLISEPGRYFVEGAFALCSRIYRMKIEHAAQGDEQRRHYFIAQGVQGVFKDCLLCNESFLPIPLALHDEENDAQNDQQEQKQLYPSTVHGPSGADYDVICRNHMLPELRVGDWLVFDRMGAYTLSIASRNGRPPVRYVIGGGDGSK